VPPLQALRIAERRERQLAPVAHAQKREVGVGIIAERARIENEAVGSCEAHLACPLNYVAIGQDEAVGRDQHAGTDARAPVAAIGFRLNPHDSGADAIDHAADALRKRVEENRRRNGLRVWSRSLAARIGSRGCRREYDRAWFHHSLGLMWYAARAQKVPLRRRAGLQLVPRLARRPLRRGFYTSARRRDACGESAPSA